MIDNSYYTPHITRLLKSSHLYSINWNIELSIVSHVKMVNSFANVDVVCAESLLMLVVLSRR